MVIQLNRRYLFWAVLLFVSEVLIAVYVHDQLIRPYIGDFLVVILLYCMVKAVINIPVKTAAIGVLLFSYLIETLQYFKFVSVIGLGHSKLANILIGNYFAWMDMVAYTAGIVTVWAVESRSTAKQPLEAGRW